MRKTLAQLAQAEPVELVPTAKSLNSYNLAEAELAGVTVARAKGSGARMGSTDLSEARLLVLLA